MFLILISIILLESVLFGIVLPDQRKKNKMFIIGALIAILLTVFRLMYNNLLIWSGFIIGHIILFGMYLIYYYQFTIKTEKTNLKLLFARYVRIPTFFYIIPVIAVLYVLIAGTKADEVAPVLGVLFMNLIASSSAFIENKVLNDSSKESLTCIDQQNLKQYIYIKNALIAGYALVFSISAGLLYVCMIDFINENRLLLIFVLEFVVNMSLYLICYYKIKVKFMPEDIAQYGRWQLIIPKKVGVGYTFNFSCPLTYVILGILFIIVVFSLL